MAATIAAVLAPDGSYLLNIKEHAADGERHLYVKDLIIAHKRQWGWRFVDEFCWRKTDNGVPGGWGNRFKNAWEPVFHFCRQAEIKFRPKAVGHVSEDCFDYSPNNPKSTSGSGLLGTGARGSAAAQPGAEDEDGRFTGIARPSNVVEVKSESSQGSHSAPFPRALVEFFVKAFSDPETASSIRFSGAVPRWPLRKSLWPERHRRRDQPGVLRRHPAADGEPHRRGSRARGNRAVHFRGRGRARSAAAAGRQSRLRDSRRIQHHGPAPFYGGRQAS